MTSIFLKNVCTFHRRAFYSQLQMLIWPIASCCPCQCFLFHQLYSTHFVVCWVLHVTIVSAIIGWSWWYSNLCNDLFAGQASMSDPERCGSYHVKKAHSIQFKWISISLKCPIQLKDRQAEVKRHPQLNTILRPWSEPPFTAAFVGQRIANGSSSFLKYNQSLSKRDVIHIFDTLG